MKTLLTPPRSLIPAGSTAPAVCCPVRWTCPVCRQTVAAREAHPHLAAVLDAGAGGERLVELADHPAIAGVDVVREDGGSCRWLVWSVEGAGAWPDARGARGRETRVGEALTLQLRDDLERLGLDPVSDPVNRWCAVGWANGLALGLSETRDAQEWADSLLECHPEAAALHEGFAERFGHEMARTRDVLGSLRSTFGALAGSGVHRWLGISVALGIRAARDPDLATGLAEQALQGLVPAQAFLGSRLRWLSTAPTFRGESLLIQVLAFSLRSSKPEAWLQAVAVRRVLRKWPKCANSLRVDDWARAGFVAGFELVERHPSRAEAILRQTSAPYLRQFFAMMSQRLGLERRYWTPQRVTQVADAWLVQTHENFDGVPMAGLRDRFRVAAVFDLTFWFGMGAAWIERRHPKVLVLDRN